MADDRWRMKESGSSDKMRASHKEKSSSLKGLDLVCFRTAQRESFPFVQCRIKG